MDQQSDARLLEIPLQSLDCTECVARVLVRKSTWQQTSIQWTEEALESCRELPATRCGERPKDRFIGCESLRNEIREATNDGRLEVVYRSDTQTEPRPASS
ncbi:ferredoxin [Arthrobacter sp. AQ5-05]|uniref:ferredoxin n=1 Tax=Arthrobacter sp. AQ5-05 TaxID=2184581 RepID=UPI000DCC5578|nr:ferredoxin [Arthrobacter sp. AQ5-05]RAX45955.1 ferredoxin [Arthrobacter sp. AQ5-05]